MLLRFVTVEILKLRRSLALLLCVSAPFCVVLLSTLIALDSKKPSEWSRFGMATAGLWSFAMLPLAVTALSVLMAQMEHGPKTWNHLLALPGARPWAFVAKAMVMMGLVALMSAALFVMLGVGGGLANIVRPGVLTGTLDPGSLSKLIGGMFVASLLVSMLQLWVALAFRSFVPPLVFGIAGTLVAVGATASRQGVYFPWLLATNILSTPDRQAIALWLGGGGGMVILVAMLVHMIGREA
ncbi:ABC transporter permease [soil metagenome]